MNRCLVVVAKVPERGQVKTRIGAELGDDRALELYQCALKDTLALALSIADAAHVLSYAPPTDEARHYFEQTARLFALVPQRGASLGERLSDTFAQLLREHDAVVMIGSDCPDVPPAFIRQAFDRLCAPTDVVLGPADDGGYYLIGMRSMQPSLFERITWGTEVVAEQTRARAVEAGLSLAELPLWHDLDTVADLQSLVAPGARLTRAWIEALNADKV